MSEAMPRRLRCAVYTRVSTDDGLDQEYNSIDAQRDAGHAYIASQRAEGWIPVADDYDDPAYSQCHSFGERSHRSRRVVQLVERTEDRRGQPLLIPDLVLEGWWTSLDAGSVDAEQVILLYPPATGPGARR